MFNEYYNLKANILNVTKYSQKLDDYWQVFKEILLKIGFIEETRTAWGNKEVTQIFLSNSLY